MMKAWVGPQQHRWLMHSLRVVQITAHRRIGLAVAETLEAVALPGTGKRSCKIWWYEANRKVAWTRVRFPPGPPRTHLIACSGLSLVRADRPSVSDNMGSVGKSKKT
ncbi:hypothetical protein [Xanthomonas phage BUDD]|nr:hypothetical protein [Xanthomonas phage BUDD]